MSLVLEPAGRLALWSLTTLVVQPYSSKIVSKPKGTQPSFVLSLALGQVLITTDPCETQLLTPYEDQAQH